MKKSLLLPLPFILSLVACGGTSGGGASSNSGAGGISNPWWSDTGTLTKDADGNVSYDEVTVNLATVVAGDDFAPFKSIVGEFNDAYRGKINIVVENIGEDDFDKNVSDRVKQKNSAPDLVMSHQKGHMSFVKNKIIQPFDSAIEKSGIAYSPNDIVANLADDSSLGYDGHVLNIPVDGQSIVLLYNKELLSKYSKDGNLPEGKEAFSSLCAAAKAGEGAGFIPFSVPTSSFNFFNRYLVSTALAQNDFSFFNKDGHVAWADGDNKTAFVNGINSVRSLFYGDSSISTYGNGTAAAYNNFYNDKSLFLATVPWSVNGILAEYGSKHGSLSASAVMEQKVGGFSSAGLFSDDISSPNAYKIFGDSHAFALTSTVTDINVKAAALEFVHWFINDGAAGVEWAKAGHISASHAINNSDEYKNDTFVSDYTKAFYLDVNEFVAYGNTPYYTVTFDEFYSLMTACLDKSVTQADIESKVKTGSDKVNQAINFLEE